jgi:hypothetical protein
MELKKTFIKDLDERLVPDGEYIDALNVTIDTTSGSNIGAVSNSLGNTLVSNIQQLVEGRGVTYTGSNAKTIGAVTYEADNLIYWLVTSDTFDAIFEYSEIYQFTSIVLLCTQGQLNFNKSYPVTGINFIPVSRDEGPFIYWTDGLNPPRRINISRCKSYTTDDPRIVEDINVILRPPLYSPKIDLSFDPTIEASNNIQDKFIYFSYRFKYKDNQYSSLSPFSSVAFHASGFAYDYNTGDNKGMLNKYNKVDVTVDTGNEFVEQIQLLYFDTYRLNVYIIDNYNRYTIPFSANKIYTPLESSEVTRLFDNVPLSAKAQEIIGNRLVYGNYVQFRDIVNANGIKIVPDYTLNLRDESITTEPKKTFRSDRDYEIGIIYLDEYGRMTTALTSKENTLYIPSLNSDKANSIEVTLNNEPPFWATNYRFAIKQSQGDYYNIFPRLFIADGVFRYFLINESDRDKITVGGYIIFKTSNGIATYSNKQFKVLELEYKDATSPFSTAGLYFKIKADPADVFLDNPQSITTIITSTGRGPNLLLVPGADPKSVVINRNVDVSFDKAFYSGTGDNTLIEPAQAGSPNINLVYPFVGSEINKDLRISIKILPDPSNPTNIGTHFQWTTTPDADSGWNGPYLIPDSSTYYDIDLGVFSYNFYAYFDDGNYNIGDVYAFNIRSNYITVGSSLLRTVIDDFSSPYPYSGIPTSDDNTQDGLDPDDYGGHSSLIYDGPIYPGAAIEINILEDTYPGSSGPLRDQNNSWTSNDYYRNLEEWFWKSGAYQSFKYKNQADVLTTSANNIMFRRSNTLTPYIDNSTGENTNYIEENINGYLTLLVRGVSDRDLSNRSLITVELKITQTPTVQLSAETVPLESDIDVFYEMRKTYRIENGNHMVSWPYVDFTEGGSVFPTVPEASGKTVLGPANPNLPTSTDLMHSFNVGEKVWVQNSDTTPPIVGPISGEYTILYVTNYAIVIDLAFPGIGLETPGKVYYKQWESDQDFNNGDPLIVELNNVTSDNSDFNAFAFGNGVESYRIYDNFLRPTMKYSPRATSVIEDYKQEDKIASLCYSGIYKGDTSTNRLNSFNLSQANFKNLDKQYGPIQKLYALDTNLMVLQQDKITSVLYGKNLLVDAVGGGQVASVPEVLGNQIVHPSEYGISNNPESFAKFANIVFFTDARRGAVLQMTGDQVMEISANGMKNYFRDELKDNPNTQKLGMYDPYNETYVLAFTDAEQEICNLSLSQTALTKGWNTYGDPFFMFSILSSTYWTITLEDTGDGTDWIDLVTELGYGDQDIYANIDSNETESVRSADFVVEYCDGLTATFTLTQNGFILPPPPEEDL